MMKRFDLTGVLFLFCVMSVLSSPIFGQPPPSSLSLTSLSELATLDPQRLTATNLFSRHVDITRTGMTILGAWAMLNLAGGIAGRSLSQGATRYFYEMNAAWNVVNLSIAGFSYFGLQGAEFLSTQETFLEAQKLDKLLLFNSGLDVAYMAVGTYLIERGIRKDDARLKGYGKSMILQGGFLFLFDLGLYAIHHHVTHDLIHVLGGEDGISGQLNLGLTPIYPYLTSPSMLPDFAAPVLTFTIQL